MSSPVVETLDELLSFQGVSHQIITHPQFGSFRLRKLTADEVFQLTLDLWSASGESEEKQRLVKKSGDMELLSLSLVNTAGEPILPVEQVERLGSLDGAYVAWLLYECRTWSGLNQSLEGVIRTVEKN